MRTTFMILAALATLVTGPAPAQDQQPRQLNQADLAKLRQNVQKSKEREAARLRQAQVDDQAFQRDLQRLEEQARLDRIQREEEQARADAELRAEMAARRQAWDQQAARRQRELDESLERFRESTARREAGMLPPRQDAAAQAAAGAQEEPAASLPGPDRETTPERAAEGGPLRFVLSIGLQPRQGDRVNPTCYSSVITRPGPPGWGQGGFLPAGSGESARQAVESLRASFMAACRSASGREVTSEGNFHWTWNETQDGEQQIAATGAQHPEDVTVDL